MGADPRYSAPWIMQILHKTSDPLLVPCVSGVVLYPHNSNPNPASAAALLRHEDAATSAAGALDADSNGSEATAE